MSVIGPRPGLWNQDILTAERDKYNANDVKPGLTGWAQINGRDELEIPDKAKLDPFIIYIVIYYTKLFKYRTAGIREYWIVDPSKNLVVVYNFELGETEQYTLQDSIKVGIYDELVIDFGSIEL